MSWTDGHLGTMEALSKRKDPESDANDHVAIGKVIRAR